MGSPRRKSKAATSSEIPSGIETALAAEAAAKRAKAETDAEKIARLEQALAATEEQRKIAVSLLQKFGKSVSVLGGQMQACVEER